MLASGTESNLSALLMAKSDSNLLRSDIPEYACVGFACATGTADAVTLTLGLVTGWQYPESRPIRVSMSRDECRHLAAALARLAQLPHGLTTEQSTRLKQ